MPTPAVKTVKKYNVTLSERQAIESLSNNKNLVIKEADKGAAVVVMNADFYVNRIEEIITVSNTYESLSTNIDKQVMNNLKKMISQLKDKKSKLTTCTFG